MIKEIKKEQKGFHITISTSTFIPKPHTPFEFVERADKKVLENRINYLKKSFHKIGVDFRPSSVDWDIVQSVLSRFQGSLADYLIDVVDNGANLGAFKKTWREYNKKGLLTDLGECAKAPLNNIKTLEWDFIEIGVENLKKKSFKKFLVSLK